MCFICCCVTGCAIHVLSICYSVVCYRLFCPQWCVSVTCMLFSVGHKTYKVCYSCVRRKKRAKHVAVLAHCQNNVAYVRTRVWSRTYWIVHIKQSEIAMRENVRIPRTPLNRITHPATEARNTLKETVDRFADRGSIALVRPRAWSPCTDQFARLDNNS